MQAFESKLLPALEDLHDRLANSPLGSLVKALIQEEISYILDFRLEEEFKEQLTEPIFEEVFDTFNLDRVDFMELPDKAPTGDEMYQWQFHIYSKDIVAVETYATHLWEWLEYDYIQSEIAPNHYVITMLIY